MFVGADDVAQVKADGVLLEAQNNVAAAEVAKTQIIGGASYQLSNCTPPPGYLTGC